VLAHVDRLGAEAKQRNRRGVAVALAETAAKD